MDDNRGASQNIRGANKRASVVKETRLIRAKQCAFVFDNVKVLPLF